jgi:hypothetical protein
MAQRSQAQILFNANYIATLVGPVGTLVPDDIINAAVQLMRRHDSIGTYVIGDFSPALQQLGLVDRSALPQFQCTKPAMNFLYWQQHWLLMVFSPQNRTVTLYDSLRNPARPQQLVNVIQLIYPFITTNEIDYPTVDQQPCYDPACCIVLHCILYCIAYAFSIILGYAPETEKYNTQQMRTHLRKCILEKRVLRFPLNMYILNYNDQKKSTNPEIHIQRASVLRKQKRMDPLYRAKENERRAMYRQMKRQIENENRNIQRKVRRLDPDYKENENKKRTKTRTLKRQDPEYKEKENEKRKKN